MTPPALVALVAIALVALVSMVIGSLGVRVARTTSDFLVASRTVGPVANASAISGEYLSYASFLGIAGVILVEGLDGLWYAVAFCGGYLALVLFVAAPLRRSGAYTVPDFAEARLDSRLLRSICTVVVLVIAWVYLLPQLQGAGIALTTLTGLPRWVGIAGAGLTVVFAVVSGGMRSITFVQAFQFWIKCTALAVPALVVLALFLNDSRSLDQPAAPRFADETTVQVETDAVLEVSEPVRFEAFGKVDGRDIEGPVVWSPGRHEVSVGTRLEFEAGAPVPTSAGSPTTDRSWLEPMNGTSDHQLLEVYSVLIAGFLGTMGMPHLLVRFYTNPDGWAARRTTVVVLAMIGGFYMLVTLSGALSRLYVPELLVTGRTEVAVMLVPAAALGDGWAAWLLGGLVAAGVSAAFLSTSSGLVVSVAGVLFTDVLRGRWRDFRFATVLAAAVPLALALALQEPDFQTTVPLVFAVAASTFCPLLVLGIWWRGLTAPGAVAGVLTGGLLSVAAVTLGLVGALPHGWIGVLLANSASVTVPLAFLVMVVVSKLTRSKVPSDVDYILLRLHAPERLGLSHDRLSRNRM